jgi:LacI family transcriptional regulator
MKRTTISDVAKLAGVSKSTVSHVLNDTRFVESETKARVLRAIAQLNFRPSKIAQSLTTNKTHTIGIIVSDITNHYFGELIRSIEVVLDTANYSLVVCNTDEQLERERHYLNLLTSQQVDAIIAAATSQHWDELSVTYLKNIPTVFLDRKFAELGDYPFVGANNQGGTYMGTAHLIQRGFKNIGILAGFQRLSSMRERLQGYKDALAKHKIPIRDEWIAFSELSIAGGYQAATQLLTLSERPEALMISNNFLSLGTLMAIRELGLNVPQDIALVGFDDHPWATVSCPPLTVVRQPVNLLGKTAAEMALALLNNSPLPESQVILECELIVRESCGQ